MEKYKNLVYIFRNDLSYDSEVDREVGLSFVKQSINEGFVNIDVLRFEINDALNDSEFDWVKFAHEHRFIWDIESNSNKDVIDLMKYIIWDLLYPDEAMDTIEIEHLISESVNIIKNNRQKDGWMLLSEVYDEIKKVQKYQNLEFYYMYHLLPNTVGKVQRRYKKEDGKIVGYLRIVV